jgi:uncharacterized protein with PQ loop repeat
MTRADALELGRAHFGRQAWTDAYAQLSSADEAKPLEPADLERLAVAAQLSGREDATVIFALSALPMLLKAAQTKNLASYSLGNIVLSNVGIVIYAVYVFDLPMGPVWALHSFYLVTTGLMLVWYVRYVVRPRTQDRLERIRASAGWPSRRVMRHAR